MAEIVAQPGQIVRLTTPGTTTHLVATTARNGTVIEAEDEPAPLAPGATMVSPTTLQPMKASDPTHSVWWRNDSPDVVYFTRSMPDVDDEAPAQLIDEDNFASDTETKAPTQQSVKAYVDGKIIDEDDLVSDDDKKAPSQQSVAAYVNRRDPFLARIGWWKEGGAITDAGSRRANIGAVTVTRWDAVNHEEQSFTYAARTPLSFQYYDRNGLVTTGFDGSDVSTPQNQIQTAVGYDLNGTLSSIADRNADTNDGVNYRFYLIPQTGEIIVLLPQIVQTTTVNAFYRLEDETNDLVLPAALTGAILLGVTTLDENAGNFTFSVSTGPIGTIAGQAQGTDTTFTYVADATARDALTAPQLTEGGVVGVGSGAAYEEWRILVVDTDWATSTKERIFTARTAPEAGAHSSTLFNGTVTFTMSAFSLRSQQRALFQSNTDQAQNLNIIPSTTFGKTVFVNGAQATPNGGGVVTVPNTRRAVVWQTFADANALTGATYIETLDGSSTTDIVGVADNETVLINVDARNNTLYPFSTGETWAQVKAKYSHLRISGNASVSGSNNVKPYSFDFDPTTHTLPSGMSGARIDIDSSHNGVTAYLNFPADTDTGLTFRQSGGDVPAGGRMQFKVVGVEASKTVINPTDMVVTNPSETDTTKVLQPNGDGTATFKSSSGGGITTQIVNDAGAKLVIKDFGGVREIVGRVQISGGRTTTYAFPDGGFKTTGIQPSVLVQSNNSASQNENAAAYSVTFTTVVLGVRDLDTNSWEPDATWVAIHAVGETP